MPMSGNSLFDSRRFRLAAIGILLALATSCLALVRPTHLPLHHDTSRDLHGALTALDTDQGPLVGPPTSAGGVFQGGFWTVHLATILGLGGGLDTVATVSLVMAVLSLLALALAGIALWESEIGLAAALVAGSVLVAARTVWIVQWNPSILLLPAALTLLFLLEGIRYQRVLPLALGAASLGLTLQLHPAAWLLLPMATWTVWRHFRRCHLGPAVDRLLCWLLLAFLALAPFAIFGAEALYQTLLAAGQASDSLVGESHHATAWWCAAALVAAGFHAFATIFRPAYARSLHYALALWAALPAALFLIFYFQSGLQPAPRYLLPYLPATALVVGALPSNLRRVHPRLKRWNWLRSVAPVAASGLLIALTATALPAGITYTYAEARWVAEELTEEGICEPGVVAASLHGAHAWALHGAVEAYQIGSSAMLPCYRKEPTPRLVLRLADPATGAWPKSWRILPTGDGMNLAMLPLPQILDWSKFQWRDVGEESFHPAALTRDQARSGPGYPAWQGLERSGKPGCVTLRVTATVPAQTSAVVAVLLQAPLGGNTAEIVATTGLDVVERGTQFVRLRGPALPLPGEVELRWCTDHPMPQEVMRGLPPVVTGVGPEGEALLTALRTMEVIQ